jgi:hypothetical protein
MLEGKGNGIRNTDQRKNRLAFGETVFS